MRIAVLTFEGFNELDSFVASAMLNRGRRKGSGAEKGVGAQKGVATRFGPSTDTE